MAVPFGWKRAGFDLIIHRMEGGISLIKSSQIFLQMKDKKLGLLGTKNLKPGHGLRRLYGISQIFLENFA
jgi:hypothetical protein